MKRARKTFKAILAVLLVGVVISVSSWAFAQGGGISGSVNDLSNNQGIQGVIITVKDVSTSALAGTGNTDALGNYSVSIPSLGDYTTLTSKLGYDNMTAPDVIELSDTRPNRIIYYNDVEGGGKVYDTNLSIFWDHAVHGPWGSDQDNFSTNQFKHPYQESIYYGFARSDGLNYGESLSQIASDKGLAGEPIATGTPEAPKPVLSWETGAGKSYLVPALEIPGFILLLNGYDRFAYSNEVEGGKKVYDTNPSTFWDHVVHGPWGSDQDNFSTNQFKHPYQGSMYYGFARSSGLSFWESSAYTFAGSFLWETGGETTPPSVNDQIASGIAGSFFGEPLFRMASLILEGDGGKPELWREICATVLSPPLGFNRLVFGDDFKSIFPSHNPATFWRLRLGATLNSDLNDQGASSPIKRGDATADFSMAYGLPGKPGYG